MCDSIEGISDGRRAFAEHGRRAYRRRHHAEAYLIATPQGLVEVFNAVDKALSSPKGYASVELATPNGESFTLHIVRQLGDVEQLRPSIQSQQELEAVD